MICWRQVRPANHRREPCRSSDLEQTARTASFFFPSPQGTEDVRDESASFKIFKLLTRPRGSIWSFHSTYGWWRRRRGWEEDKVALSYCPLCHVLINLLQCMKQSNYVAISYDQRKTALFIFYFFWLIFPEENFDMGHNCFNIDFVLEWVQRNVCQETIICFFIMDAKAWKIHKLSHPRHFP